MGFITGVNFMELGNNLAVLLEGYGVRPQNIFLISDSKLIATLMGILKTILKPKIIQRIQVIRSHEELHDAVPREMLPKDYGGEASTLKEHQEKWIEALSSEDCVSVLRTMDDCRTDEARRTAGQFSEHYAGLTGTFRYLNVD
ncbi:alpha-tocopherol transfer protein-like [Aricia agestis]|uniref:alpha-tocopherol transfer protein-like n=1 Tax=Aricia agestis TaxID=91739 RepID=UPI001C2095A7|nr:alpha-tocopherol transfer protein-like [Aricia agestis]